MDSCVKCGAPVEGYTPQFCCTGEQCGCGGLPIEPPLCDKCAQEVYGPRRVVFLDLDGVLNTTETSVLPHIYRYGSEFTEREPPPDEDDDGTLNFDRPLPFDDRYNRLSPDCVRELNRITDATGAKIVVSSTWRIGPNDRFQYLKQYLKMEGITGEIIGRTPDFVLIKGDMGERGHEIHRWLEEHPADSFVILDDNDDMAMHMAQLVKTKKEPGLTRADADLAIEMLKFGEIQGSLKAKL